ncbi:hypothetical protein FRC11_013971, partial [Ceratobasidium sp. 423]
AAVDEENRCRMECDAKLDFRNIAFNRRLQLAEWWVSQVEPLGSPSPILDQAGKYPWEPPQYGRMKSHSELYSPGATSGYYQGVLNPQTIIPYPAGYVYI